MMNAERTYGVEVEFISTNHNARDLAIKMTTMTGIIVDAQGYNHRVQNVWKIVTDASLSSSGRGYGLELVSPKLKGEGGLEQVRKLMNALNELGAEVNRTCGLHVHHDVNDKDLDGIKKIVARYLKLENSFDALVPQSRRLNNNGYTRSLKITGPTSEDATQLAKRIQKFNSIEDIIRYFGSRYFKLNLQSYLRYGTVEVRQHSGTTDAEKIVNWILLTQRLVENTDKNIKFNVNEKKGVSFIKQTLHIETEDQEMAEVLKYYRKREKELSA